GFTGEKCSYRKPSHGPTLTMANLSSAVRVSGLKPGLFGCQPCEGMRDGRNLLTRIPASEIGSLGLRNREQVLAEMIPVVFGTDHLQERVRHLAPASHHVERFIESVRVVDFDQGFQRPAIGGQLKPLDNVQLLAMRCTEPIEKAVANL